MSRRPKICACSIEAGPGSCIYWWETCPKAVGHCFMRFVREHGTADARGVKSIDMAQAQVWAAERDAAL